MKKVLIVGAGLIGSATAWRLAQAGARVSLIDACRFGGEASAAGTGMLSPGGNLMPHLFGLTSGLSLWACIPRLSMSLRTEAGMPIDFEHCGCRHFVARDEARTRAGVSVPPRYFG